MKPEEIAHPPIASEDEWLKARLELLAEEKAHTKEYDRINAKRRRLPMVKVEKSYTFETEDGPKTLLELFDGHRQLILYHFMFAPEWEKGCPGCTSYLDSLADLSGLERRNTKMVLCSRAPLSKLLEYRKEKGWKLPWVSSGKNDFNFDFKVTLDSTRGPVYYNYKDQAALEAQGHTFDKVQELPGTSVFFQLDGEIYFCYGTYQRGGEALCDSYRLLDITPYGRQEDFEDSPEGWPQSPTYG